MALVISAVLTVALAIGSLWAVNADLEGERHGAEIAGLQLELSAARVEAAAKSARIEIARIAGDADLQRACEALVPDSEPSDATRGLIADVLRTQLAAAQQLDGAVVLGPGDRTAIPVGSGAGFLDLVVAIDPGSGLETGLGRVMMGIEYRKQLSQVSETSIRILEIDESAPAFLASDVIRNSEGEVVASVHGHLRREVIPGALGGSQHGKGYEVSLMNPDGLVLSSSQWTGESVPAPENQSADFPTTQLASIIGGFGQRWTLPVESQGWIIAMDEPVTPRVVSIARAITWSVGMAGLLTLLFASIALRSGTRIARPLWSLLEGMNRLARGEDAELEVPRVRGELESVIRGFNLVVLTQKERREDLERESRSLRNQNECFQIQHESLSKLSITDQLTTLPNRRFFDEQLGREIKRLSRHKFGLSLLIIDIDDFKKLNDDFGHAAGDEFLRQVARILKESVRDTDLIARYGGEEFVIVCTATEASGAAILGEKVRTAVAEASFIVDETKRPRRATISIGVSSYRGSRTDLFNSADAALYEAKAAGKNCVVIAPSREDETAN